MLPRVTENDVPGHMRPAGLSQTTLMQSLYTAWLIMYAVLWKYSHRRSQVGSSGPWPPKIFSIQSHFVVL